MAAKHITVYTFYVYTIIPLIVKYDMHIKLYNQAPIYTHVYNYTFQSFFLTYIYNMVYITYKPIMLMFLYITYKPIMLMFLYITYKPIMLVFYVFRLLHECTRMCLCLYSSIFLSLKPFFINFGLLVSVCMYMCMSLGHLYVCGELYVHVCIYMCMS